MKNKYYLSEKDYNKGISLMIRFCLDFVIVKNKQLLLVKRLIDPYKGMWHLPGGMVRKGESIKSASKRILISEIGLGLISFDLLGYIEFLDEKLLKKSINTHSVSLVFKTIVKALEDLVTVRLNLEHSR